MIPALAVTPDEIRHLLRSLDSLCDVIAVVENDDRNELSQFDYGAAFARVEVLTTGFPVGKSAAVRRGLRFVLEDPSITSVVQVDGHSKQPPRQVAELLLGLRAADMAAAQRYTFQDLNQQPHRKAVTTVFSTILRVLTGVTVHDIFCGTRAYTRKLAEAFAEGVSFGYGLEVEELLLAGRLGAKIVGVPVLSNCQADSTAVEKIEENLSTILMFMKDTLDPSFSDRLSNFLWLIKRRSDFEICLSWVGISADLQCTYVRRGEDGEESFSFRLA